eukprot:XP_011675841.1 PREDICTED: uncharacterized protein LOC105443879 [Strongylocentrotus purpuratus]
MHRYHSLPVTAPAHLHKTAVIGSANHSLPSNGTGPPPPRPGNGTGNHSLPRTAPAHLHQIRNSSAPLPPPSGPPPTGDSCEGACGGMNPTGACFCDAACMSFGDCCRDYQDVCQRVLLMLKKGLEKKVQLIETHFEEIVDALDKRKKKIIRSLKQNTKANKALIEIKKKAMEKERAQLKECRRRHQDKVRDRGNGRTSDIMINSFLAEVDDIQRKARKMSTENATTELDELEVVTDSEVEGSIKDAVEKLATLRETAKLLKSRVGTPTSSPSWSLDDSTPSSSSPPQRGRPMSLRVPVQPHRTQSLSPNPHRSSRLPVTPREVRSAADGDEIQDLHTGRFLPNIPPPPPTAASASQRPQSGQRRQPGPPDENMTL